MTAVLSGHVKNFVAIIWLEYCDSKLQDLN